MKGYLTNTAFPALEVYFQYNSLWAIYRVHKITKGTVEPRPKIHFSERRIEVHVCMCLVTYKVYKELERIIKPTGIELSVDQVSGIAKTTRTLKVKLPVSSTVVYKTVILTKKQKKIAYLSDNNFWKTIGSVHFG